MLMKMEEELNTAMIECAKGDDVWCMTNFECGKGKMCTTKKDNYQFEDFSETCEGNEGGCTCEVEKENKRCNFDPRVRKAIKDVN